MLAHRHNRPLLVAAGALVAWFAAPSANAGPDDGIQSPDRPATWDMSLDELRAIGLGQYRGDPIPVPEDAPRKGDPDERPIPKMGTIFVNFDGETMNSGYDDSRTNTTQLQQLVGPFAAYGNGPKRDATLQAVVKDWEAYNVIVTDSRPGSGDYTMNMTGPTNPFGGGVLGIAPLDCNDQQTHNNITYAFHSDSDFADASIQATTIGQEVAHSYGLEHVDETGDIMNPYNSGGDPVFNDRCIQIVQGGQCASQHQAHCGSGTQQNGHQELLTLFGPSAPDTMPPTATITYPDDGDNFETGASFEITADVMDDMNVKDVTLYVNGSAQGVKVCTSCSWGVTDIPEGSYEVHVLATDNGGNEAMSDIVEFTVGNVPGSSSGGDSDSAGDGSGTGSDGGDSGLATAGDDGGEDDRSGCGCRNSAVPVHATWLGLLLGLGAIRRRP